MRLRKFISATERKAIENAVRDAEKKTSGQIVPAIVASSSRYDWIGYRAALVGWAAASLVVLWLHFYRPFLLEFWETQSLQMGGLVVGWLLSRFRFGVRLLVHEKVLAEEVSHAAYASFVRNGLMNTRDRTGVLLFVSLREGRVQILADKGIHEKVGERFWKAEADRIVGAIRAGKASDGMVAAISSIGDKLHKHFPRRAEDTNELPDRLRTE